MGWWFNIFISKGGGCGAVAEINVFEQCERRVVRKLPMNGLEFLHSPSQQSLTPQPQLRLPLHHQPQPCLHPLHPSGSFSEGGDGGCSAKLYK